VSNSEHEKKPLPWLCVGPGDELEHALVPIAEARELYGLLSSFERIEEDLEIAIERYSVAEKRLAKEATTVASLQAKLAAFEEAARMLLALDQRHFDIGKEPLILRPSCEPHLKARWFGVLHDLEALLAEKEGK